jgi:iron complex outermembrane receptor protein
MNCTQFRTMASILGLVGFLALAPAPVYAQSSDDIAADSDDGAIIVTAQRRSEKQVDVPITITAISQQQLQTANVQALTDISKVTPGLRFDNAGAFFQPTIRGVGTAVANSGGGSNVGVYVDGFYSPNPLAGNFQLTKIEGVQVLKGPQGTLFGHNTTGGAILVQTADPRTTPAFESNFSFGRFEEMKLQAYATYGLTSDIAMDIEGSYKTGNGYLTNISSGRRVGDYKNWSFRTGVKAQLSDDVSVLIRYQHSDDNDPTPTLAASYFDPVFGGGQAGFATIKQYTYNPRQVATGAADGLQLFAKLRSDVVQGTIKADLGFANLTSYSQYRWEKGNSNISQTHDGTAALNIGLPINNTTWSQEFLLTSKSGSALQWTAGLFAFSNKDIWQVMLSASGGNAFPAPLRIGGSGSNTKSVAGFVDATYEVTPQLFVTAGGRYSHDEVVGAYFNKSLFEGFDPTINTPVSDIKSNHFTPRIVLRYKPDDHSSIYASFTKGYKASIIDVGGSCQHSSGGFVCNDVKPENINAFEVGYKYASSGVTVELSGFNYDYKNLQVSVYDGFAQASILNAASSKIYGIDAQFSYKLSDSFSINAGGAWTHARYKSFPQAPIYSPSGTGFKTTATPLVNVTMQHTPEFTGNVGMQYKANLANGSLDLSSNLFYSSKLFYGPSGIQFPQKSYALLSLHAKWTDSTEHYTLAIYGDNVTNTHYMTQVQTTGFGIGANWNKPATYGVEFGVKF